MLGYSEIGIDGEQNVRLLAAGDVIARDLAVVVRTGVHVNQTPIERNVVERGLLANLADGRIDRLLTRLDQPLGKSQFR